MQNNNYQEVTYLKPWVNWLIQHNLKFVIYFIFVLFAPIMILCHLGEHVNTAVKDIEYEFSQIKGYKKHE